MVDTGALQWLARVGCGELAPIKGWAPVGAVMASIAAGSLFCRVPNATQAGRVKHGVSGASTAWLAAKVPFSVGRCVEDAFA